MNSVARRYLTSLKPQYFVSLKRLFGTSPCLFETGATPSADASNPSKLDTHKQTEASHQYQQTLNKDQESEQESSYEADLRCKILDVSLQFVPEYGWSKEAISKGAETLGYPGVIHGMFPKGGFDLIQHFYLSSNKKLIEILKQQHESAQSSESKSTSNDRNTRDAIEKAVRLRLEMIIPYIKHWPQALAIMSLPPNVPTSLANLLTLVDDIYYYTGDKAIDMSWYGRRIVLAGIYKSTELYMLQDASVDYNNSWEFLHRRMDEASSLRSYYLASGQATHIAKDFATSAFITARSILGLSWNR